MKNLKKISMILILIAVTFGLFCSSCKKGSKIGKTPDTWLGKPDTNAIANGITGNDELNEKLFGADSPEKPLIGPMTKPEPQSASPKSIAAAAFKTLQSTSLSTGEEWIKNHPEAKPTLDAEAKRISKETGISKEKAEKLITETIGKEIIFQSMDYSIDSDKRFERDSDHVGGIGPSNTF